MSRKFYIIGHNPNSVQAAIKCLKAGANAIEPDVRFLPEYDEKFFVYDLATENPKNHTLKDYLTGLAAALNKEKLNLALLAFDLKPSYSKQMENASNFYMKEFFSQLNEYFFKNYTSVPVLITVGDSSGKPLLATAKPYLSVNQAVGVDESDTPKCVADIFEKEHIPFAYANGTSSPFASPEKFMRIIKEAIAMKQQLQDMKLVYTWTVNSLKTMRDFADAGVDGIITDKVARLKKLIDEDYKDTIELATADYNPFK
jgi:hypothetical protein